MKVSLTYFGTIGDGSTHVELFSDNSTAPGTLLRTIGTLADTSLTNSLTIYDFTLSTPYELAANTRYWIALVADPTNGSVAAWSSSDSAAGTGVSGEYLEYQGSIYTNDNGPWNMEVMGSAVPEPASIVSALSGIVCLACYTFHRQRKTASVRVRGQVSANDRTVEKLFRSICSSRPTRFQDGHWAHRPDRCNH